jgi:hypothetical protein
MAELDALTPPTGTVSSRRLPPSPAGSLRELLRDPLNFYLSLTRQYMTSCVIDLRPIRPT